MFASSRELKYCPFRIHGETKLSATINGESFYNEYFMPCMKDECVCYRKYNDAEYCYRDNLTFEKERLEVSRSRIDELPTIDIVHCDECKFWKGGGGVLNAINGGIYHWCEKGHKDASPNWFCADGERTNDNDR